MNCPGDGSHWFPIEPADTYCYCGQARREMRDGKSVICVPYHEAIGKTIVSISPQGHDGDLEGPAVIHLSDDWQIVISGVGLYSGGGGIDLEVRPV